MFDFTVRRGGEGPLAELEAMLIAGDTAFEHTTFRLPVAMAGNDQTYATSIMFERDNDLVDGYLSTAAQLVVAQPARPEHVCPVPRRFWESPPSIELLGERTT